jgi:uncharacterized protein YyaL (SSP411 family)
VDDIAKRLQKTREEIDSILKSAQRKMYAARLNRPTPYVDKTVYVSWNGLCISAYLKAAQVLHLDSSRKFALRSLDRILSRGWDDRSGLRHVIAYSDPQAAKTKIPGVLDDYAFVVIACLDAYEATADPSYYHFAEKIAETMIRRFQDPRDGGFFDIRTGPDIGEGLALGALAARRKPMQDSPTPAGNPAAAIGLLRLYAYSNNTKYRDLAEATLKAFAGIAGHYGLFAATYGIALDMFLKPHTQIVIAGSGAKADRLYVAAVKRFALNKSVLRLAQGEVVPQMLPPALAETIPNLPAIKEGKTVAVVCSGFACQPPVESPEELMSSVSSASERPL